jgi:co-chaperonin GroES (HSP10)
MPKVDYKKLAETDFNMLPWEKKRERICAYIEPKHDKIIVMVDDFSYTGSLVIPGNAQKPSTTGTIIAAAKNLTEEALLGLKVGDRVLYGLYSGAKIGFRFETWPTIRSMRPDEVIAKLKTTEDVAEVIE